VDQPTVLIISDDVDFSRRITARWQMERTVPAFTLLSGDLWPRFAVDNFDIAIVGELRREVLSVVLEPLHSTGQPIFYVCEDPNTAQLVRERWPRTSVLRRNENWLICWSWPPARLCIAPGRKRVPAPRNWPAPVSIAKPLSAATCSKCVTV